MNLALDYIFTVVGGFLVAVLLLKGIGWVSDRGVDRDRAELLDFVKFYNRDELEKMLENEDGDHCPRDAFSTRRKNQIKRALEIVTNIQAGGRGSI